MILNNYWELVRLQNTYPLSADGNATTITSLVNHNGYTNIYFAYGMPNSINYLQYMIPNYTIFGNNIIVRVGSSDEEGSISDYNLKTPLDERYYTIRNLSINNSLESTGGTKRQITFDVINSASNAVTIKEVGIIKIISTSPGSGSQQYIMIARVVLDEPLTLAIGETGTITLLWVES